MEAPKLTFFICIGLFVFLVIFNFTDSVTDSNTIGAQDYKEYTYPLRPNRTFFSFFASSTTVPTPAISKVSESSTGETTEPRTSTAPVIRKSITPPVNLTSIPSCVPYHKYMTNLMEEKKGKWTNRNMSLLLLSAFDYDTHVIVTTQSEGWYGKRVFCRFLSSNFTEIGPATAGMSFPEYSINCCARREKYAYISVTERADDPIIQYVPVSKRNINTFQFGLSMCLAPIYGDQSIFLLLAELIEHYKLQGIDHFYVYVHQMDEYSMRLIHDYIKSGEVEAVFLDWREDRPSADWQLVGVMDCLHRSRFQSKYAIFADLDERILPSSNVTLAEYSRKKFEADPKLALLSFRPRWILRERIPPKKYEGMKTLESDLPTLVFHNTSGWPGPGHTSKCITDPTKVLIMWVHYAHAFFPGFDEFNVPPEDAIIRHYRDVVISDWGTRWMPETLAFGNYTWTNYPFHLQDVLVKNVALRLGRVYSDRIT